MKSRRTCQDILSPIVDPKARSTTYSKRRKHIVGKLMELGNLCDVNIYLMIFNKEKQALYEYKSEELFSCDVVGKLLEPELVQYFKTKFETVKDLPKYNLKYA